MPKFKQYLAMKHNHYSRSQN